MEQKKIDRINELSRLARERELTNEEKAEREVLRREYIDSFKASLIGQLENTSILYPDGTKKKITAKDDKK